MALVMASCHALWKRHRLSSTSVHVNRIKNVYLTGQCYFTPTKGPVQVMYPSAESPLDVTRTSPSRQVPSSCTFPTILFHLCL